MDTFLSQKEQANCFTSVVGIWFLVISREVEMSLLLWKEVSSILGGGLADTDCQNHCCLER